MSEDLGERTAAEEAARREEASDLEGLKDLQQGWDMSLVHKLDCTRSAPDCFTHLSSYSTNRLSIRLFETRQSMYRMIP